MKTNEFDRAFREALARKYPMAEEARQFVHDIGLNEIKIEFHKRADLTWFSILGEARKQGQRSLDAVYEQALKEYPGDEGLRRLREGQAVHYAEGPDVGSLPWHGRSDPSYEKILGRQSSLVSVSFLDLGVRCTRPVVRIQLADGSLGTGFLVRDDLLITNHHVICDQRAAVGAMAQFNYQKTADGLDAQSEELPLDPDAFFITSKADDCTIIKVRGTPSERWGVLELQPSRSQVGDRVNIIQHPGGNQKQLSFYHNLVVYVGEGRVQYLTDTLPGSSGSPVFDKDWRLCALHHSGGWIPEPGTKDRFFRNEGILIDRVINLLARAR